VHRPGYRSAQQLRSELAWLHGLGDHTDLGVARPRANAHGEQLVLGTAPGVPEARWCSLLSWVDGRMFRTRALPVHALRVGRAMAVMHRFAEQWEPGEDFERPVFDHTEIYRLPARTGVEAVDTALPTEAWDVWQAGMERRQELATALGRGPEVWGLAHLDLHFHNVVFQGDRAVPIDFDDGGFGHFVNDLAIPWGRLQRTATAEASWSAFQAGYRERRALDPEHAALVPTFAALDGTMAARWLASQQHVPAVRARTTTILETVVREIADALGVDSPVPPPQAAPKR